MVKKAFEGKISINQQKCPEGCHDCVDVCPITGTLSVGEDKKVYVNDLTCTYCGACKNVCPVEDALTSSPQQSAPYPGTFGNMEQDTRTHNKPRKRHQRVHGAGNQISDAT